MTAPTSTPPATGTGTAARSHPELLLKLVFHAPRAEDPRLNEVAAERLMQFGTRPVRRLVRAADQRNGRAYWLRVLAVIGPGGRLSCSGDAMDLSPVLREKHPAVREAVHRVLPTLGIPACNRSRASAGRALPGGRRM